MSQKTTPTQTKTTTPADRKSPPLPDCQEVLRRCRMERLGHKFADNLY